VDDAAGSEQCEDEANDSSFDSSVGGNIEDEERLPATAEVPLHAFSTVPRGHLLRSATSDDYKARFRQCGRRVCQSGKRITTHDSY
jgi:hypothetical protein